MDLWSQQHCSGPGPYKGHLCWQLYLSASLCFEFRAGSLVDKRCRRLPPLETPVLVYFWMMLLGLKEAVLWLCLVRYDFFLKVVFFLIFILYCRWLNWLLRGWYRCFLTFIQSVCTEPVIALHSKCMWLYLFFHWIKPSEIIWIG